MWPLMQTIALFVQVVFLISIYLNLLPLHKAGELGKHLNSGASLFYAIFSFNCVIYVGLLLSHPTLDQATQLTSFRIFGVSSAVLGLVLAAYSKSAKKKLLAP